jgi:hypothetical protein
MAEFRLNICFIFLFLIVGLAACNSTYKAPDLGGLYNGLVQNESPYRNPAFTDNLLFFLLESQRDG